MHITRTTATRLSLLAVVTLAVVGVAALPAAAPDQTQQQATARMGFVASELILRQTPGYAQAESTFNTEFASWRQEVQVLQTQLDSAINAFNQQAIVLSPTARQERQEELRRLQETLGQRTSDLQSRAQTRQAELVGPLEERIQRVIDGLRAERNLGVIFDVSAPGNNIVSADPVLDLTTTVVRRLQGGGQ